MANKPEQRYELRNNSAEEEKVEKKQPPKKIEQITLRDIMDAIDARFEQQKALITSKFYEENARFD